MAPAPCPGRTLELSRRFWQGPVLAASPAAPGPMDVVGLSWRSCLGWGLVPWRTLRFRVRLASGLHRAHSWARLAPTNTPRPAWHQLLHVPGVRSRRLNAVWAMVLVLDVDRGLRG